MLNGYAIAYADPNDVINYPALRKGLKLLDYLEEAIELGADSVEIHTAKIDELPLKEIGEYCNNNLQISAIGTGLAAGKGLNLTSPNPDIVKKTQLTLNKYINIGASLKSKIILGSIRGKNEQCLSEAEYTKYLANNLLPVLEYAKENQVEIVMEIINRYELPYLTNVEKSMHFINTLEDFNLFLHLDTFHMNIEEASITKAVELAADKLRHVHIADNTRFFPSSGCFDFATLFNVLKSINYNEAVSMECLPMPGKDIKSSIKQGLNFINKLR